MHRPMVWYLVASAALALAPAHAAAQETSRVARSPGQPWQCAPNDSVRAFQRALRLDSAAAAGRAAPPPAGTTPISGGTPRSHEFPEYDVVLDVPNLCVDRIFLKVDTLTAKLTLDARVANLVRVNAGADVHIGNVDLTIEGVRARALLLVDLDDVVYIVDQTLTFVDNHPEIVQQLGSTLQNVGSSVGGAVGTALGGLVIGVQRLATGNTLQRVVDQATGRILERTLGAAGNVLTQRVVGSLLDLRPLRESTNAAGNVVRQVRDQAGSLLEYTLDRATNRILGVRLLERAAGTTTPSNP